MKPSSGRAIAHHAKKGPLAIILTQERKSFWLWALLRKSPYRTMQRLFQLGVRGSASHIEFLLIASSVFMS
jgi:hypothetical protein